MYLLLRDNKQTGPYTLDELKAKGMKAYDLVWVEGRSAAWRYPSEIDELRAFSPAVEEQPFDRFFKKPGTSSSLATAAAPTVAAEPLVSNTETVKRTIYVTMPSGVSRQISREIPRQDTAPPREAAPTQQGGVVRNDSRMREADATDFGRTREADTAPDFGGKREPDRLWDGSPARESAQLREMAPARERADYGRSRSGHRRQPVEEILPALPGRASNRAGQLVLVGITVVALLAAGIFIGLSIQKNSSTLDRLASQDNGQPARFAAQQVPVINTAASSQPGINPVATAAAVPAGNPAANGPAGPAGNSPGAQTASENAALTSGASLGQQASNSSPAGSTTGERKHRTRQKPEAPDVVASQASPADSLVPQPEEMHRETLRRTDQTSAQPAVDKERMKLSLANQVSVGTNKFEVGTFGGIHNLQVTVTNRSAFALDLVVVQIDYIQANKKTYKSENLYFRGIAPGSALMLEAPKTSRGINIQYKITSINSKELGLSEPGT